MYFKFDIYVMTDLLYVQFFLALEKLFFLALVLSLPVEESFIFDKE